MKKFINILFSFFVFGFVFAKPVLAGNLNIVLNEPLSMENTTDFQLFYTAMETDQQPIKVNLFLKKDGSDWKQAIDKDKTGYAGYFQMRGEDFYGEGEYYFYAHIDSGSQNLDSNTIVLTLDTSAPETVIDYRKEKVNETDFRLYFTCPTDEDFEKVYVYRSGKTSFLADGSTKITEVGCAPGESKNIQISGDKNVDYYFALRALDHAGNASEVVTDAPGTVFSGQVAGVSIDKANIKETISIVTPVESSPSGELGGGINQEVRLKESILQHQNYLMFWVELAPSLFWPLLFIFTRIGNNL
jgi:hypothetical protein